MRHTGIHLFPTLSDTADIAFFSWFVVFKTFRLRSVVETVEVFLSEKKARRCEPEKEKNGRKHPPG